MPPKTTPPRRGSSTSPDELPGDLRREDQTPIAPDSLPESEDEIAEDEPVGAHNQAPDGGDNNHPIHDDDPSEDFTPRDYEEQIDEVAEARRGQRKRADVEEP